MSDQNNHQQHVPNPDYAAPDYQALRRGAEFVVRSLRAAGYEAYLVGGCVRDRFLGRAVKEYDIATEATPDQVARVFRRTVPVGAQFGVMLVLTREGEYEVATFRAEASYSDGRRPDSVRFVSAREDVLRRDFTINGLLEDPDSGEVRDFVDGMKDLEGRLIRAIGDPRERFVEDHLRMLRAVRFSATLGFDVEPTTLAAATEMASAVAQVSVERIVHELSRTFREGDPVRGFDLLVETAILPVVLPEAAESRYPEVRAALSTLPLRDLPEVLALLLDGQSPDAVRATAERLKLSKADRERLVYIVSSRPAFEDERSVADTLRFIRHPFWPNLAEVHLALLRARGDSLTDAERLVTRLEATPDESLHPPRLMTGRDLSALGLKPGPHFKVLLNELEDAQLEGRVTTRDEAEAFIRERSS